jgi:hypothetical protein
LHAGGAREGGVGDDVVGRDVGEDVVDALAPVGVQRRRGAREHRCGVADLGATGRDHAREQAALVPDGPGETGARLIEAMARFAPDGDSQDERSQRHELSRRQAAQAAAHHEVGAQVLGSQRERLHVVLGDQEHVTRTARVGGGVTDEAVASDASDLAHALYRRARRWLDVERRELEHRRRP